MEEEKMKLNKLFFNSDINYTENGEMRLSIKPTKLFMVLAIIRISFEMIVKIIKEKR